MMRRIHGFLVGSSVLAAVVLTVVVAAHVGVWYFICLSGAVASALIALAVIKHLGWLGGATPRTAQLIGSHDRCNLE